MAILKHYKLIIALVISCFIYTYFGYFLDRTNFSSLSLLWVFAFIGFFYINNNKYLTFKHLAIIGVLFRLIFIASSPNLSQDFYRFIWDGRMLLNGYNPYLYLPKILIEQGSYLIPQAKTLYNGMGSLNGSHYTNYPPLNQLSFYLAALFSSTSIMGAIITLRLQLILADIGILYFGSKLLKHLNLPLRNIFLYFLNPFIIIELTGNLHFEAVMLFFLIFGLYKLHQKKWLLSALLIGCAVSVKLIPLLFLPLFLKWLMQNASVNAMFKTATFSRIVLFYSSIILLNILLFLPFLSAELISNYTASVGLWFKNFEFNASFYYIFREIGFYISGYNQIAIIGKLMPIITILFLVYLTFFKQNQNFNTLLKTLIIGLCFYYFFSSTVHPWYIATPLLLSVFTNYKFVLAWSFAIILSYQAYANLPYTENLYLIFLEYVIVFSVIFYDYYHNKKLNAS